jgi:hypothetical protein
MTSLPQTHPLTQLKEKCNMTRNMTHTLRGCHTYDQPHSNPALDPIEGEVQ